MKERMTYSMRLNLRFVQFSLGLCEGEEFTSGKALEGFDWDDFHRFARKQTLTGVVFEGIQRLPREFAPRQDLLMAWLGESQGIRVRNSMMNTATARVYDRIRKEGYRCCILKGQGNALIYPTPLSRTPGDVDVWVTASRENIRHLATSLSKGHGSVGEESLNHIEMTWNGVAVELHSTPAILNNPLYNRRLQRWLRRNADQQCSNIVALPDGAGEIAVPTAYFNIIYQLFHLYHHYFYEGVGLRQVIDYLLILKDLNIERLKDDGNIDVLRRKLKWLGLWKFAGAMMYVLHETLGLEEDRMIVPMDEKRGKPLLDEILEGGNFGQHGKRQPFGQGAIGHNIQRFRRDLRLLRHYPAEALSEPLFRAGHYCWRTLTYISRKFTLTNKI